MKHEPLPPSLRDYIRTLGRTVLWAALGAGTANLIEFLGERVI